jgi:hypothetical protein
MSTRAPGVQPKQRLFLSAADLSSATIGKVSHPRTRAPLQLALVKSPEQDGAATLLEIQKFSEPATSEPRSWLIAGGIERVQQDGSLFLATPLDPLFLLLPRLRKLRGADADRPAGYYKPMSELSDAPDGVDEHEAHAFEKCVIGIPQDQLLKRLRAICDVNDKYDEPMLRLSDEKLRAWLRRKAAAVQAKLQANVKLQAMAAQKTAATHCSQFDEIAGVDAPAAPGGGGSGDASRSALELSVALVCEYLEPEVEATLCASSAVPASLVSAQRGPEKKAGALQPVTNTAASAHDGFGAPSAAASWEADLAEADAEAEASCGVKRPASAEPPVAKKPKPAAPAKSKLGNAPLKKGQTTMMGFFKK